MAHAERRSHAFTPLYDWSEPIPVKMAKVAHAMYGAREVTWTREAQRALAQIEKLGFGASAALHREDAEVAVGRPAGCRTAGGLRHHRP